MYISVPGWTINVYCNVKLTVTIAVLPLLFSSSSRYYAKRTPYSGGDCTWTNEPLILYHN